MVPLLMTPLEKSPPLLARMAAKPPNSVPWLLTPVPAMSEPAFTTLMALALALVRVPVLVSPPWIFAPPVRATAPAALPVMVPPLTRFPVIPPMPISPMPLLRPVMVPPPLLRKLPARWLLPLMVTPLAWVPSMAPLLLILPVMVVPPIARPTFPPVTCAPVLLSRLPFRVALASWMAWAPDVTVPLLAILPVTSLPLSMEMAAPSPWTRP